MGEVATESEDDAFAVFDFLRCVALRCVARRRGVPRRDVLALTHVVIRARSDEDSSCFPAGKLSKLRSESRIPRCMDRLACAATRGSRSCHAGGLNGPSVAIFR